VETTSRHCTSLEKKKPLRRDNCPCRGMAREEARDRMPVRSLRLRWTEHVLSASIVHRPPRPRSRLSLTRGMSAAYVPSAQVRGAVALMNSTPQLPKSYASASLLVPSGSAKPQLTTASFPRRRAGSRSAVMIRTAIASRNVLSGISDPGNGSGMSKPSLFRRGIRCT